MKDKAVFPLDTYHRKVLRSVRLEFELNTVVVSVSPAAKNFGQVPTTLRSTVSGKAQEAARWLVQAHNPLSIISQSSVNDHVV